MARTQPNFGRGVASTMRDSVSLSPEKEKGLMLTTGALKKRPEIFGHDFYRSPKADLSYRITHGNSTNNEKRKNFADLHAKSKSYVPGPKYVKQEEWKERFRGNRGKFLGGARRTFTDEIMEYEKKTPAPSKYDNKEALKKKEKIPGNYSLYVRVLANVLIVSFVCRSQQR